MATDPWCPHYNLIFEIHDPFEWNPYELGPKRFREMGGDFIFQTADPEVPNSITYPLEEVAALGRDYFGSSLAYMLGYAVFQKRPEIHIMGFEMQGQDGYAHQRHNSEYWIGVAEGRGIPVETSEGSKLLRLWDSGFNEPGEQKARELYGVNGRYGYLKEKPTW